MVVLMHSFTDVFLQAFAGHTNPYTMCIMHINDKFVDNLFLIID